MIKVSIEYCAKYQDGIQGMTIMLDIGPDGFKLDSCLRVWYLSCLLFQTTASLARQDVI